MRTRKLSLAWPPAQDPMPEWLRPGLPCMYDWAWFLPAPEHGFLSSLCTRAAQYQAGPAPRWLLCRPAGLLPSLAPGPAAFCP